MLTVHNRLNKLQSYSLPSNSYISLTLGASGSTYTAPADGWVALSKSSTGVNQFLALVDSSNALRTQSQSVASGAWLEIYLPVKKGRKFIAAYSVGGSTNYFRFIYALGSEPQT